MRNRRAILFFAVALLSGLAAASAARSWVRDMARARPVETLAVVVAREDTPVGTSLAPEHLHSVEWPKALAPAGVRSDPNEIVGRVLARRLTRGEPVLEGALLPVGSEAGLASLIPQDARAVSVRIDAVVGVAGFVRPGSRVDVLATVREGSRETLSQIILQNVRVLAIDQDMHAESGEPRVGKIVTLEVTLEQARKLAAHERQLHLALRNPRDERRVPEKKVRTIQLLRGAEVIDVPIR